MIDLFDNDTDGSDIMFFVQTKMFKASSHEDEDVLNVLYYFERYHTIEDY